jgi:hypothetical protein
VRRSGPYPPETSRNAPHCRASRIPAASAIHRVARAVVGVASGTVRMPELS